MTDILLKRKLKPECWDDEYEGISSYEASAYESEINRFIEDFTMPEEKERGLMNWYGKGNSVDEKVRSAFMSVEERDGELVGVITAQIYGQLTEKELEEFSYGFFVCIGHSVCENISH